MTFQKDQTTIAQSAVKAAAELTSAELAAGIIKSHDATVSRFEEFRTDIFEKLDAVRVVDNEMFKTEEAASPKSAPKSGGYQGKSGGNKGGGGKLADVAPADAGAVKFIGSGKFAGCSVAEVYAMTSEETAAFGYPAKGDPKPGSAYIEWVAQNEKNPSMQAVVGKFMEHLRASSDAA